MSDHRSRAAAEHRKRNPEKARAWNAVQRAVKSGLLVRPEKCSRCDVECKPEASHDDYDRPLDVEWLCKTCHRHKDRPLAEECPHGHPFDEENTYRDPRGYRCCRQCRKEASRREYERRTA